MARPNPISTPRPPDFQKTVTLEGDVTITLRALTVPMSSRARDIADELIEQYVAGEAEMPLPGLEFSPSLIRTASNMAVMMIGLEGGDPYSVMELCVMSNTIPSLYTAIMIACAQVNREGNEFTQGTLTPSESASTTPLDSTPKSSNERISSSEESTLRSLEVAS